MTVVYVAGQARCGSSLTMAMLEAGGMPVVGSAPSYEVSEVNHRTVSRLFLGENDGRALKLLDPLETRVPRDVPAYAIWLTRDPLEQAKSHAKFLSAVMQRQMFNRQAIREVSRGLRRDEPAQMAALGHCAMLVLSFEEIITTPQAETARIAQFLGPLVTLDAAKMAAVVLPRSPKCQLGIDIEIAAMEAAEGGR